jgi:acyl-ACP thioesterase
MDDADLSKPAGDAAGDANIWQESYRIRSYEVDCRNRLSILSTFNYMQEAASRHAAALGVSIHQLLAENHTWLLSRLKIKIAAYPRWNDQIRASTWPSGARQLFALRDFELTDTDNRPFAKALSAWLVIDLQRRRPIRIEPFLERLKPIEGSHAIDGGLDKLPPLKHHTHETRFVVRFSDLDINQHVNNVKFVEWVIESLPPAVLNSMVLSELEINFLAEAFYGDQILAACSPQNSDNTQFLHRLTRGQDRHELVRARTKWREVD